MTDHFGKYINPFTDFGFKKLFGTEFNKELLISFLNEVLGDKEKIQDLTYINNEALGRIKTDRSAIFDLYCKNEEGELFIVELQNVKQEYFIDRSIFYSTFPIQSQAPKRKGWDYQLKAVYTVGILNFGFSYGMQQERYLREVMLIDKHTHEISWKPCSTNGFTCYETCQDFRRDQKSYRKKYLGNCLRQQKLQEPEEMKKYDESLKIYRDNENTMEYAKKIARKEGMEEGREVERIELAKMFKKNGASVELIAKSTGLSREQIEELD